jgi:hypothetical protein
MAPEAEAQQRDESHTDDSQCASQTRAECRARLRSQSVFLKSSGLGLVYVDPNWRRLQACASPYEQ